MVSMIAGAIGGFAASFITGAPGIARQPDQTTFQIVRTQELQLIDAQGRTRGTLGFSAERQPYLRLRDENDAGGVWVGVARETGVTVRDKDGKTRLVLSIDETGTPSLVVRDRNQQTRSFPP
jgi:hypothetical protein